jgi:protein TonB
MSKRILMSFRATSCGVLLAAGWFALHTSPLQGAPVTQEMAVDSKLPQDAVADSQIPSTPADASAPTRIRVGGNVQQAKLLVKAKPVYPPKAKANGVQGMVRIEATIARDRQVADLKVLSGNPLLATAAVDAVRQQRYAATILDGAPVEVVTEIDVRFTLIAPQPTQTFPSSLAALAAGRPVTIAPW